MNSIAFQKYKTWLESFNQKFSKIHIGYVLLVLCLLFSIIFISIIYFDPDCYFLIETGEWIWSHKRVPIINPFVHIDGLKIIVQQPLWCVITYLLYSNFNRIGLFFGALFSILLAVWMAYRIGKIHHTSAFTRIFIPVVCLMTLNLYTSMRPTSITLFLLLAEIYIFEHYTHYSKKWTLSCKWYILGLFVIGLIMINIHAAFFPMLFIFALPYIVPAIKNPWIRLSKLDYKLSPILIGLFFMGVSGFLNPYGVDGILYLFHSYNNQLTTIGIGELNPLNLKSTFGIILIILMLWMLIKFSKENTYYRPFVYLTAGTFILLCLHQKNISYFVVATTCLLLSLYSHQKMCFEKEEFIKKSVGILCKIFSIFALILAILTIDFIVQIPNQSFKDCSTSPIQAVKYLDKHYTKGDLIFTDFNMGSFLEFNNYKVHLDARPELYFKSINQKKDYFKEYGDVQLWNSDLNKVEKFLETYNFDYLIINRGYPIHFYLQSHDEYELILEGSDYLMYRHPIHLLQ